MSNTNHLPTRELVRQTAARMHEDADLRWQAFVRQCVRLTGKQPNPDASSANPVGFNGTQQQEEPS